MPSVGIGQFLSGLVVAAIVTWIVRKLVNPILDTSASVAQFAQVERAVGWFQILVENFPALFLLLGATGALAWVATEAAGVQPAAPLTTTVVSVGAIVSAAIYAQHLLIVVLGPTGTLYGLSSGGFAGANPAKGLYLAISVWVPWLATGAGVVGAFWLQFRQQSVVTERAPRPGGPR